jgi:hypothetical protein
MTYPNGASYTGEWRANQRHGQGTYRYPNGDLYCGQWARDIKSGPGSYLVAANHTQMTGQWVAGKCVTGTWEFFDGQPFFGVFRDGQVQRYSLQKDEVEQWHALHATHQTQARTALLSRVFDAFDADRNRGLTTTEWHAFCKLIDPSIDPRALFGAADTNNNQRIDKKEFVQFGLKMAQQTVGVPIGAAPAPGSANAVDPFTLAMRLALAAKNWVCDFRHMSFAKVVAPLILGAVFLHALCDGFSCANRRNSPKPNACKKRKTANPNPPLRPPPHKTPNTLPLLPPLLPPPPLLSVPTALWRQKRTPNLWLELTLLCVCWPHLPRPLPMRRRRPLRRVTVPAQALQSRSLTKRR